MLPHISSNRKRKGFPNRSAAATRRTKKLMGEKNISGVPVVEAGKLVGMITEEDIMKILAVPGGSDTLWLPSPLEVILEIPVKELLQIRKMQQSLQDVGKKPVSDVMARRVVTVAPDADIEEAATLMVQHKFTRLPVVKAGRLVGIIARDDIIHGLVGGSR